VCILFHFSFSFVKSLFHRATLPEKAYGTQKQTKSEEQRQFYIGQYKYQKSVEIFPLLHIVAKKMDYLFDSADFEDILWVECFFR